MSQDPVPMRQIPPVSFPEALPVSAHRDAIASALAEHQVIIVAGETGSGKTTQLPKLCLQLGRGLQQRIGHTQPRRLAARTVAARIAEELDTTLGDLVGYQVRFHDKVSDTTAIKLMTDGILLAQMQKDKLLRQYDTLIIDEAHERSLNIDFILGYLKRILPQRPDLKVIVTSATIDVEGFSRHFNDAPVIEVSGRSYPIETHYLALSDSEEDTLQQRIAMAVEDIANAHYGPRGDVLVFLPGERDIRETARALRHNPQLNVLPLYARLSHAEQSRVFESDGRRSGLRVVLATNVAETSLTVPGIRYVIDPGLARISRYSHRSKLQRLPIEAISRASADQRRGRCGRVGPGVCLRLYSEEDYLARPEFTDPEITRTNLAAVVLQMLTLGLGDIEHFPFLNPPDGRMVRDGYKLLEELGAVDAQGTLTPVGRTLSRLPVDPRLARMAVAAPEGGVLDEVLIIASALAVQDPRERPADKQTQADQAHARFRDPKSDFLQWLNLWHYYEEQRQALSQNQLRKLCKREFLSFMRMREWRDIHRQLMIACKPLRPRGKPGAETTQPVETASADAAGTATAHHYDAIHRALLSGLLSNIAQWQEGREYLGARNRKLQIFPGSGVAKKKPKWLVAAQIVETSRVFARDVAQIDPRWALDINPSLVKSHYHQPRWQPRRGQVVAYLRSSLYGLTLSDKTVVHYGPIAPEESREIMIREGLIPGRVQRPPGFLKHNLKQVKALEDLESRTRRRDLLVDEQIQFQFYDERLPDSICTLSRLQAWLKREKGADASLRMSREQLSARSTGDVGEQFPDRLEHDGMQLRLSYRFEPGGESDGVSVTIPVALLNRAPRFRFDWLVPGLLREKCIALVKALPKEKRKRLVPVPDYVDQALEQMSVGNVDLLDSLASTLQSLTRVPLSPADWQGVVLDDYYRMNVRVVDAKGALLDQGRDLERLVNRYRDDSSHSGAQTSDNSPVREGLRRWDFGDVPREWRFSQAGMEVLSFPALVDQGETVSIALHDYANAARAAHRRGVLRLLRLDSAQQVKYLRKQVLRGNAFNLLLAQAQLERDPLVEDLIDAAYVQAMGLDENLPFTDEAYAACKQTGSGQVVSVANALEAMLGKALEALGASRGLLAALPAGKYTDTRDDIQQQLDALLAPGFLSQTPAVWLEQYPRYLQALRQRLDRLSGQYPKDQTNLQMLGKASEPLWGLLKQRPLLLEPGECDAAIEFRWMLEEFRVSLFAQQLGTRQAVSQKRLAQKWEAVEAWCALNPL